MEDLIPLFGDLHKVADMGVVEATAVAKGKESFGVGVFRLFGECGDWRGFEASMLAPTATLQDPFPQKYCFRSVNLIVFEVLK